MHLILVLIWKIHQVIQMIQGQECIDLLLRDQKDKVKIQKDNNRTKNVGKIGLNKKR